MINKELTFSLGSVFLAVATITTSGLRAGFAKK